MTDLITRAAKKVAEFLDAAFGIDPTRESTEAMAEQGRALRSSFRAVAS